MFTIYNDQLLAFAIPFSQKKRKQIIAELTEKRIGKVYEEGRDVVVKDSKGNNITIQFNEKYKPAGIIKPSGMEYGFDYDEQGRLVRLSLPGEERIEWEYTAHLLTGIRLNNAYTAIEYNKKNKVTALIHPDAMTHKFQYDAEGRLHKITGRANETTTFETLLRNGCLAYVKTDELGRITEFESNELGTMVTIVFPDGSFQQTAPDMDSGEVLSVLKNTSVRLCNYEGGTTSIMFEDGGAMNIIGDRDHPLALENENGTIFYKYDNKGRKIYESFGRAATHFRFDGDDTLTNIRYPSGLNAEYQYDEDGRLKHILAGGKKCMFRYGLQDTVNEIHYPNGIIEYREHKIISGLHGISIKTKLGERISMHRYGYDHLSRLVKYSNRNAFAPYVETSITYDLDSRVTGCTDLMSGKKETFQYDKKGNMTGINGACLRIGTMDQVLSFEEEEMEYDGAGNITFFYKKRGVPVKLRFSDAGVLTNAYINGEKWEYRYDALGRRISKSNDSGKSCTYTWMGNNLLGEKYGIQDKIVLREYIYTPYNAVPFGFIENGKSYWLHSDVRGAVYSVTNEDGTVVWHADYTAFGCANIAVDQIRQPWRLPGHYYDEETGLHYNVNRYYNPRINSYISLNPDWSRHRATNYFYAGNNPFNYVMENGTESNSLTLQQQVADAVVNCVVNESIPAIQDAGVNFHRPENLFRARNVGVSQPDLLANKLIGRRSGNNFLKIFNALLKSFH